MNQPILDKRRVLILDDDPTGTQTSSGVRAILRPRDATAIDRFFASPERAAFVITNSRAVDRGQAAALVRQVVANARTSARRAGEDVAIVLRGDSTLRGHVFAETDAVDADACVLFVPAFPEGGRTTIGGVQRLDIDGVSTPVAETEFARDPVFGYRSSRLDEWVAEVAPGRAARLVGLDDLRATAGGAVTDALLRAKPGEVVAPDVENVADVRRVVSGLLEAERQGGRVVVRGAATLAATRAGLEPRAIEAVDVSGTGRVLVVCGSWTSAATRQIVALGELYERRVEVHDRPGLADDAAALIRPMLAATGTALVCTPRAFIAGDERSGTIPAASASPGPPTDVGLRGQHLMDSLVSVVAKCAAVCDAVIAKGGITSARVAAESFGAAEALVQGQLSPGVPLWTLPLAGGPLPYAVVPGNVGGSDALATILAKLR